MNKKFNLWMSSIDDRFLEEASTITKKTFRFRVIARVIAACLILAATGLLFRHIVFSPDETNDGIIREYFTKDNTDYTILSCEATEATNISGMDIAEIEPLVWYAGGLEIKLCSTNDTIWASWYDYNTGTQWCLMSDTSSLTL